MVSGVEFSTYVMAGNDKSALGSINALIVEAKVPINHNKGLENISTPLL